MPKLIEKPTRIQAAGNQPKLIDEYAGRVNNGEQRLSIAHMRSPSGWVEPGPAPRFRRVHVVLRGACASNTKAACSRCGPGKRCWRRRASGSATARPAPRAPSTRRLLPAFGIHFVHRDPS